MIDGDVYKHYKLNDGLVALEYEADIALIQVLHEVVTQGA